MNKNAAAFIAMLALLQITACASAPEEESVILKNDAIDDYIKVAELKEVDEIRKWGELHQAVATEKYIILSDRKNAYLAVFRQRCRELDDTEVTPDLRHDLSRISARFETYRGCRIQTLYALGDGQAQEILSLGAEPGK